MAAPGAVLPAASSGSSQCIRAASASHALPAGGQQVWRPAGGSSSGSRRGRARAAPCRAQAKSDVGRVLRDALAQPAQGANLNYLAAANFLRGLGIDSQAELNRVLDIAMNPNSLFLAGKNRKQPTNPHARKLDVDADLKPLVAFLQDTMGFSQEQVAKLILAHPPLLSYRVEDRLQPFYLYLTGPAPEGLALTQAAAVGVVERRPTLLGVEVGSLRRMVGYLLESGQPMEQVVEMMSTSL